LIRWEKYRLLFKYKKLKFGQYTSYEVENINKWNQNHTCIYTINLMWKCMKKYLYICGIFNHTHIKYYILFNYSKNLLFTNYFFFLLVINHFFYFLFNACKKRRKDLNLIWQAVVWNLWKAKNACIIHGKIKIFFV
jgi:hypothetical protein